MHYEEPQKVEVVNRQVRGPGCFGFLLIVGALAIGAEWVVDHAAAGAGIGVALLVAAVWFIRTRQASGTLTEGQQIIGGLVALAAVGIIILAITQPNIDV